MLPVPIPSARKICPWIRTLTPILTLSNHLILEGKKNHGQAVLWIWIMIFQLYSKWGHYVQVNNDFLSHSRLDRPNRYFIWKLRIEASFEIDFSFQNWISKKRNVFRNINGDWISFYSSLRNLHKNIRPNAYKRVFIPRCCFSAEISLIFFPTRIAEILVNNTASRCERNSSVSARNSSINSAFSQCLF